MGSAWSDLYVIVNGLKHETADSTFYTVPMLIGKNVAEVFREMKNWFEDYKIISFNDSELNEVIINKKQTVIIYYQEITGSVKRVEIYP